VLDCFDYWQSKASLKWVMTMKTDPPSEFQKFDDAMKKILSVSHEELQRREKEWKKQRKRGKRAKTAKAR
jgi:hypothetical protein